MAGQDSHTAIVRTLSPTSQELELMFIYQGIKREFKRNKECTLQKTFGRIRRKLTPKSTKNKNKNRKTKDTKNSDIEMVGGIFFIIDNKCDFSYFLTYFSMHPKTHYMSTRRSSYMP